MNLSLSRISPSTVAMRVIGVTGTAFIVLVVTLLLARPEMMITAMHRAMTLIFVP